MQVGLDRPGVGIGSTTGFDKTSAVAIESDLNASSIQGIALGEIKPAESAET